MGEAWLRFSGYTNFKRAEYGVLKANMLCMKIVHIRHRLVFGVQCLENELWAIAL
jgi:hypothetical protein